METQENQIFDPSVLAEVKRLEIKSRRMIDSDLIGRYRSAFKGSGLIFSDLREYQYGDDVKNIHWKVSARSNKTYVKSYEEERQLNILIVLDCSASMSFGSGKNKSRASAEFAAIITMISKFSGDYIGLCMFDEEIRDFYPPSKKRSRYQTILQRLSAKNTGNHKTNLQKVIDFVNLNQKQKAIVFLISDFYSADFTTQLKTLALKHDLVLICPENQMDKHLPNCGIVRFTDSETGESYEIDTSNKKAIKKLELLYTQNIARIEKLAREAHADFITIGSNPIKEIKELIHKRNSQIR